MNSLIVVESPTKVKTLRKYLGAEYDIRASVGHVKDLPKNKLGIDPDKGFEPTYLVMETKRKVVADLKKAAAKAQQILLAPDPDREGEAIAWHIAEEIGGKNKTVRRVLFNDLTRETILAALAHPLDLDFNRYEAQQTRRILDRLVGYQISPILWDKVKRGLSAGRVQSVAVRIICDREAEIRAFVPEEYWNLTALLEGTNPPPLEAKLLKIGGKKAKIGNAERSAEVVASLQGASFTVSAVEKKEVKRQPPPPFTTSKLQQEASRWLRFSAKKTMSTAQKLYEGIDLGPEGPVGLITYMRTDSVRLADDAIREAREYIHRNYDPVYLPPKGRVFKVAGAAQDAHEAIRPASLAHPPQAIKAFLTPDQFRLYQLIWNRFLACQMNPAVLDQTTVDITAGDCLFRALGSVMRFPGFTVLYTEGKEDTNGDENGFGKLLPAVREGEMLRLIELKPEQKFTQPPPRFSEASLVRELEENGIGRPSTYAAILSTIQEREYVLIEKGKFIPTDLGILVTDLLVKNFPRILDIAFTASMETELDRIEEGQAKRLDTLNNFYRPFTEELRKAKSHMTNLKREETPTDLTCDKCGKPMVIKWGKNGRFLACTNYPACKNTKNFIQDEKGEIQPQEKTTDVACPLCGKPMLARQGRFGKFLGCSGYPECKHTINLAPDGTPVVPAAEGGAPDAVCDKCGKPMLLKRGRFGAFLGCSGYPECKNIVKASPSGSPVAPAAPAEISDVLCDKCGRPTAVKKGRFGKFLGCTGYPECKNIMKYKPPAQ